MKLLRSFSAYTFAGIFGSAINFLLLPVLSHYLSPKDYGITSIINTYVTLLIPFVGLVAYGLISVEYYKMEDKQHFPALFSSILFIPVVPTIFLFSLFYLFYAQLAPMLELPSEDKWWALTIFPLSILSIYVEIFLSYEIITKRAAHFLYTNVGKVLLEVGLTVLFVIYLRMGWKGRILSYFITTVVFALIALLYFNNEKLLTSKIKKKYIIEGVLFGAPLIVHTVGKFVINQSDRIFIAKMISIDEAGIYNIGYTIGMTVMVLINAFSNIFTPFIMEGLSNLNDNKRTQIVKVMYGFMISMVVLLVILYFGTPILFKYFISKQYLEGVRYVFWIGLGYVFWGGYLLFGGIIYYYKQGNFLAKLAIVNVVTNIAFNYIFITYFGGIGAAYATALSFFIVFIFISIKANRLVSLPWLQTISDLIKSKKNV